ncbi:hypothetical protein CVT24_002312 [Panaeolus cyanescens]|uniref:Uncharacterized protein n=1 Tax=Panaeolus cyanescens TaxID=181874 RepID=A0A409YIS2_9AGAR|nr:hypothetical protein CVT24_002312 [Panaeolus cyanescens]
MGLLKVYHWASRRLRDSSSAHSPQSPINAPPPLARPADRDFRLDVSIDQSSLGSLFEHYDYVNNEEQPNPHDFHGDQTDEMPEDQVDFGSGQLSPLGLDLSMFPSTNNVTSSPTLEPIPLPAVQDSSVMTSMLFSPMQPGESSPSPPNYNEATGSTSGHDQQPIQHTTVPALSNDTLQEIFRLADNVALSLSACPSDATSLFKLPLVALTISAPISSADCLSILSGCTQLRTLDVTIDRVGQWSGQGGVSFASLQDLCLTIHCDGLAASFFSHLEHNCGHTQEAARLTLNWGGNVDEGERNEVSIYVRRIFDMPQYLTYHTQI